MVIVWFIIITIIIWLGEGLSSNYCLIYRLIHRVLQKKLANIFIYYNYPPHQQLAPITLSNPISIYLLSHRNLFSITRRSIHYLLIHVSSTYSQRSKLSETQLSLPIYVHICMGQRVFQQKVDQSSPI